MKLQKPCCFVESKLVETLIRQLTQRHGKLTTIKKRKPDIPIKITNKRTKRKHTRKISDESISLDIVPEQLPTTTPEIKIVPTLKDSTTSKKTDEINVQTPEEAVDEIEEVKAIVEVPKEKIL